MTEQELKAIRDRAEAATPGPWDHRSFPSGTEFVLFVESGETNEFGDRAGSKGAHVGYRNVAALGYTGDEHEKDKRADAAFIAAARADVPALLAVIDELTRDLHDLTLDKGAILATAQLAGREEAAKSAADISGMGIANAVLGSLPLTGAPPTYLDLRAENARLLAENAALATEARRLRAVIRIEDDKSFRVGRVNGREDVLAFVARDATADLAERYREDAIDTYGV